MKIKFRLIGGSAPDVDLQVTIDAATTVGDLAAHLVRADPRRRHPSAPGQLTLAVAPGHYAIDPHLRVGDSGVRSGAAVSVVPVGGAYRDPSSATAAVLHVIAGPDAGTEFPLYKGSSVIGRGHACEVVLTDPLVSWRHARVHIADFAEVLDLASTNGIEVDGTLQTKTVLRTDDTITLGDTVLRVRLLRPAGQAGDTAVGFVRPPRVEPRHTGVGLNAPEPPQRPQVQRIPIIPLLVPLMLGGVLFAVTPSLMAVLFVAMSPLMVIGFAIESKLSAKSAFRKAVAEFRADVAGLIAQAERALEAERAARALEHPGPPAWFDAVRSGGSLLWSRRPGDLGFLDVRLGTGTRPSRVSVELPAASHAPRELFAELQAATTPFGAIDGVPVVASLGEHGALGVAGPRPAALPVARAVLLQLAVLHSPAEVVLCGVVAREHVVDWDWLKWLPHTTSPHSPLSGLHLAAAAGDAERLLDEIDELVDHRADSGAVLPAVVLLVEDDTQVERSRLVELAERGGPHGVHVLWHATEVARLPAACREFVAVTPAGAFAGFAHSGDQVDPLVVDRVDADVAHDLARRLAPLVDTGAGVDDDSDLPASIALLAMSEDAVRPTSAAVLQRWHEARSGGGLRAVIGMSAAGPHAIDLRADGPHALVGGTTGSGKSELLQTWLLAMAARHGPHRLTYLLIDYKGGSAFQEFESLPHTVGLVTDLNPNEVRRARISLDAELKRRETLFNQHRVKDLAELERTAPDHAPPSLVIVVDEFAALIAELPAFVDDMVNVAQRGRSLGVHLILATQRPTGVIKENLQANMNLRLALRTADETNSTDILGSPIAAFFDQALPGRAVSKTGPGRLVPFQAGYVGGWTPDEPPPPEIGVVELRFGSGPQWTIVEPDRGAESGPADITRVVTAIRGAAAQLALPPPRKPWQPVLAPLYDLRDPEVGLTHTDERLVFGIRDLPHRQVQEPVAFCPDTDGNLAVYGTGGSGKTTLLRTIAAAAGLTRKGGPCHVHALDFGARGLTVLEDLPYVGNVVPGSDSQRVRKLIEWLRTEIDERAVRYSRVNAGTIVEYRRSAAAADEPRILLLLDGVSAFRTAYQGTADNKWFDLLVSIANEGRPVGVHVVLAAENAAALSALASAVQTRVVLRMASADDYAVLGVPLDVLTPASSPGRGVLRGEEIQVALFGDRVATGSQALELRRYADRLRTSGSAGPPPHVVRTLGGPIPLAGLPAAVGDRPVLGLHASLEPFTFHPEGGLVVCGPPGSGRTTALRTIAAAVRRHDPDVEIHLVSGGRRSSLTDLTALSSSVQGDSAIAEWAPKFAAGLTAGARRAVLLLENPAAFGSEVDGPLFSPLPSPLIQAVKACLDEGGLVVADVDLATWTRELTLELRTQLTAQRTWLMLAPSAADLSQLMLDAPPKVNRADFPPGRGLFVHGGLTSVVQVATTANQRGTPS